MEISTANQKAVNTGNSRSPLDLSSPQKRNMTLGLGTMLVLSVIAYQIAGLQQALLIWIGLFLGYALFHARFGFTSAFRRLLAVGNGEQIRAHMIMLAAASTLFAIILTTGIGFFGVEPSGYVFPAGVSVAVGAFLFGLGMQLGNGCASGTLYAVGQGRTEMVITLLGFIAGSVVGAWHWGFWMNETPALPAISLIENAGMGVFGGWLLQMLILGGIFALTIMIEKKRKPPKLRPLPTTKGFWARLIRGSWPLWVAALVLAVLNAITLMMRGNPWGITSAFALWGSKAAMAMGIDVTGWTYWQGAKADALTQSVFFDTTSVMNFGVILGAFLASAAGGLFTVRKIPFKVGLAALIGGLLMGYGARIAFGCNIGAYFGGIASFSLHGYLWMVMGLVGSYFALYIRPLFGLSVPDKKDRFC